MAKASPIIAALNAGEWSPLLSGRTDLQGYAAAAYTCRNMLPTIQGPVVRRAGTGYVQQVKAPRAWFVPFIKARNDAWVIEMGDLYCRFYSNRLPVLTGIPKVITAVALGVSTIVTSAGHGLLAGQDVFISGVVGMTQLNGRWFKVGLVAANTFQLLTIHGTVVNSTGYGAYVSGGAADIPYEIVSPYTQSDLITANGEFGLDYVQSGDVIYLTARAGNVWPYRLSRSGATSWAFTIMQPAKGPWLLINDTSVSIRASAVSGSVTLTASSSIFVAGDIGSIIRIDQEMLTSTQPWATGTVYIIGATVRSQGKEYEAITAGTSGREIPDHTTGTVSDGGVNWKYRSAGYGIARITAQAGTTATADVLTRLPVTVVGVGNETTLWRRGAFSISNGFPTCVSFFRERLTFGGGQRVDMSNAADFTNFSIDLFGEVLPESAVSVTMQTGQANNVVALTEGPELTVSTGGAEFIIDAPAQAEPFGPNNVRVSRVGGYGARPIKPIRIGQSVVFVQASGKKLLALQPDQTGYLAPDLNVRSGHITKPAVVATVRQEEPYQTMWALRSDGDMATMAYDVTQDVRAWAHQVIGGKVRHMTVIPSPDGGRDDLWLIVQRNVNGALRHYVEIIQPEYDTGGPITYGDAGLPYAGAAADIWVGFDHLEGETVGVLIDGATTPDVVVVNGEVVLPRAGTGYAGKRFSSVYATMTSDAGAAEGTAQGKTKRLTDVAFRFVESLGGSVGPSDDIQDDVPELTYRAPSTPMGEPPVLFTGDALVSWPSGYETGGRIWFKNDTMYPTTLVAIMPQVVTQESR